MIVSNDQESVATSEDTAIDSFEQPEENGVNEDASQEEVTFNEESAPDPKATGAHGFLNRLSDEAKEEAFYKQDSETRESLRNQFPDDYGYLEEAEVEQDTKDLTYYEFKTRYESEKVQEKSLSNINTYLKDNPEFDKAHGKLFRDTIKESLDSGTKHQDLLDYTLFKLSKQGVDVPTKAVKDAYMKGVRQSGQSINSTRGSNSSKDKHNAAVLMENYLQNT